MISVETDDFQNKYAEWLDDQTMLTRISAIDLSAKEVKYHGSCRNKYQSNAEATQKGQLDKKEKALESGSPFPSKNAWHQERDLHTKAFAALKVYINENIITKKEVHLLTDVNNYYQALLNEIDGHDFKHIKSAAHKLEKKLLKKFPDMLRFEKGKTMRGNIIFSSTLA